jgi:hypothetical protein
MTQSLVPIRANCGPSLGAARSHWLCVLAVGAAFCAGMQSLGAQTPAKIPSPEPAPGHKVSQHHKAAPAPAAAAPVVQDPPLEPPAPEPHAPEPPKWPLNEAPAPPTIRWDSQGLHVEATNSSLRQILDDVSTTTGAKVEGLAADERVFGSYGPGPARDVVSQILQGSSYNVLMLGDEGQGTPREIILSERTRAGSQPGEANSRPNPQDEDVEQPEPEEPTAQQQPNRQPIQPPINQPGGPMTPQQRMLEMQRQQMQMQQQQQQNQPIQSPPQPPQ